MQLWELEEQRKLTKPLEEENKITYRFSTTDLEIMDTGSRTSFSRLLQESWNIIGCILEVTLVLLFSFQSVVFRLPSDGSNARLENNSLEIC